MEGYTVIPLDIDGYEAKVANSYWSIGSDTLLVMLPGLGYTNQMPLMFYIHQLALAKSWDVLQVDYDYRGVPRETTGEEWTARMLADVLPTIEAALARGDYRQVVLAGKSIGTRVMSALITNGFDKATAYIWLTPLLRAESIRTAAITSQPSVAVFGDADYAVQGVELAQIAQAGTSMIVMPGGDHGMMIPGSVPESIAALALVMNELDAWLGHHVIASGEPA